MQRITILWLIFIGFISQASLAVDDNNYFENTQYLLNFNAGTCRNIANETSGIAGGLVFFRKKNNDLFSIRYLAGVEPVYEGPSPPHFVKDFGILFGKCLCVKNIVFSLSAGLSYAYGLERGKWLGIPGEESYDHEKLYFHTIGFPVDVQVYHKNGKNSAGISFFANTNAHRSIFGLLAFWQIRKIK